MFISLKSIQIVKKYKGKIKIDQKTASIFTASSLLKTGTKEKIPFPPKKKGLTLLYQTYSCYMVGRDGFEPSKTESADLQSAPIGRSGTYPHKKWSWWSESNQQPADYKSAALPIELHQHIFKCNCLYGASGRNRTTDTGIFSPLLYRLSYRGK